MTVEEAKIYLPFEDEADIWDVYEEMIFTHRNFFLQKPVIGAVIDARIKKLEKIREAAEIFGIKDPPITVVTEPVDFPETILDAVLLYGRTTAFIKGRIAAASSINVLISEVRELYQTTIGFYRSWPAQEVTEGEVLISTVLDEMLFLKEVRQLAESGVITFDDLKNVALEKENPLQLEMKRISLQLQKEIEWMTSLKN